MSGFKVAAIACSVFLVAFLLMFFVDMACSDEIRTNILVHANVLICDESEQLDEGIKYWQEGDLNGLGMMIHSGKCILTEMSFKAVMIEQTEKYAKLRYQVNDGDFEISATGWIARGAFSLWQWGTH